jgi:hypothetical protein
VIAIKSKPTHIKLDSRTGWRGQAGRATNNFSNHNPPGPLGSSPGSPGFPTKQHMIEKTTGFKVGETVFATLEDAKTQELTLLLAELAPECGTAQVARALVENGPRVLDILTTTPESRPKARAIHGGKKTRKLKATAMTVVAPEVCVNQPDMKEQREMGVEA